MFRRKKRESADESENIIPDYSYPFLDKIGEYRDRDRDRKRNSETERQ